MKRSSVLIHRLMGARRVLAPRRALGPRVWLAALAGCCALAGGSGHAAPANGPAQIAATSRTFEVKGVVKKIELEESKAVIQHETIPEFMDAMTMPFHMRDTNALPRLQPGDPISFRLHVTDEESWIEHVVKVKSGVEVQKDATAGESPEQSRQANGPVAPTSSPTATHHPLLDYAFTNQFGKPVRLAQLRGQALAITFIFTRCPIPDYCPRLSKNFEEASQKLRTMNGAPTNWHFISVTIDPGFDTPAMLKSYGERFGYDPAHWTFLTGPAEKIAELARLSDVKYETTSGLINHNLRTLIINPNGRLRTVIPVGGNLSDLIANEILKACATHEVAKN